MLRAGCNIGEAQLEAERLEEAEVLLDLGRLAPKVDQLEQSRVEPRVVNPILPVRVCLPLGGSCLRRIGLRHPWRQHARDAGASRLVLTHISDELDAVWARTEAARAFGSEEVVVATEGAAFEL